jgi:signal transduction histidine kinase
MPVQTAMRSTLFDELKAYIGFGPQDEANLEFLAGPLTARAALIADDLYNKLQEHPSARSAIRESGSTPARVQTTIADWMSGFLEGPFDDSYFLRRSKMGHVHVRMRLPQHFMVAALNFVRLALVDEVEKLGLEPADRASKVRSIHRIVDLEIAVVMEAFREGYADRVRLAEREAMKERLRESEHMANIGELAAALAHEIKNPLAGISGAIQVIGGALEPDDSRREVVDEILSQIDRMDATVRDLLVYARPKPPDRELKALGAVVQRTLTLLREEPAFLHVEIERDDLDCETEAYIDETQIQQVVTNLLLNAAHACENGGRVIVRVVGENGTAHVEVADNGSGMSPAEVERAFEPFYTTKAKGTGLGLPICKRIIDAHDGRIRIRSREGRGTKVLIDLPCDL